MDLTAGFALSTWRGANDETDDKCEELADG